MTIVQDEHDLASIRLFLIRSAAELGPAH